MFDTIDEARSAIFDYIEVFISRNAFTKQWDMSRQSSVSYVLIHAEPIMLAHGKEVIR